MKLRKVCFILLSCAVCLTSCADKEERSYLYSLITEEQTLLRGNYVETGTSPTAKDIYYNITAEDIDFSLDAYTLERAAENEDGLLYYVNALSPEAPDFKVYQIGNFWGITCTRAFLEQEIKKAEEGLRSRSVTYGTQIGYYSIGKVNIQENDSESIAKVEAYIQELLPELDFGAYERRMLTGDAGQNHFLYYEKDGDPDEDTFFWSSPLQNDNIVIIVRDRDFLDELLHIPHP